jgi:hypothetical protein
MILDAFKSLAPELPNYQARYRPIYFEPMVGSGERFTIAIMAQGQGGETRVIQTLSPKKMQCMYGEQAATVINLVMLAIDSAHRHLETGADLADWQPPFAGIYPGPIQSTRSNAEMEGVLFQALTSYASLYSGEIVERGLNEINHETPDEDDTEEQTATLIRQIKTLVVERNPRFAHHWQREVPVLDRGRMTIDYLGVKYNANLSNFNVRQLGVAFRSAKAKLLDLDVLRTKRQAEAIDCPQDYELLIALKNNAPTEAKDLYYNLEQLADSIDLRVVKKPTPEELAERILRQEAA